MAARLKIVTGNSQEWEDEGRELGRRERDARSLMWDIGDWWNRGEAYGNRVDIVTAEGWSGATHGTCWVAGSICKRWNPLSRLKGLTFEHHRVAAPLPNERAIPLLQWCLNTDAGEPRSVGDLRTRIKQERRAQKEAELTEATEAASERIGTKLYGVIYADPPWRFEPYSRATGMDRAADNHYPTMPSEELAAMNVPAADDCILFLWATAPMLPDALDLMRAWGFRYKSHCVWVKHRAGTGFWFRNRHELLLIGTRGDVPAPAPGQQYDSVIELSAPRHSEKPLGFAEMIEHLFPTLPAIELFARAPRLGWDTWGNEVQNTA